MLLEPDYSLSPCGQAGHAPNSHGSDTESNGKKLVMLDSSQLEDTHHQGGLGWGIDVKCDGCRQPPGRG